MICRIRTIGNTENKTLTFNSNRKSSKTVVTQSENSSFFHLGIREIRFSHIIQGVNKRESYAKILREFHPNFRTIFDWIFGSTSAVKDQRNDSRSEKKLCIEFSRLNFPDFPPFREKRDWLFNLRSPQMSGSRPELYNKAIRLCHCNYRFFNVLEWCSYFFRRETYVFYSKI